MGPPPYRPCHTHAALSAEPEVPHSCALRRQVVELDVRGRAEGTDPPLGKVGRSSVWSALCPLFSTPCARPPAPRVGWGPAQDSFLSAPPSRQPSCLPYSPSGSAKPPQALNHLLGLNGRCQAHRPARRLALGLSLTWNRMFHLDLGVICTPDSLPPCQVANPPPRLTL